MALIITLSLISVFSAAAMLSCLKAAGQAERRLEHMYRCVQNKSV